MKKRFFKRTGSAVMALAVLAGGAAAVIPQTALNGIEVQAANSENDFITDDYDPGVIIGYKGSSSNVVIPATIKGVKIYKIESLGNENTLIKSVIIPSGVTHIVPRAFMGYSNLKSIVIPDSVTSIGFEAFSECTSLTSVTLPKKLKEMGFEVFESCTSLKSITVPDSITDIPMGFVVGCTSLTSVKLPSKLKTISDYAFERCNKLTSISIPQTVTDISYSAFKGCTALKSINLPNSLTSIEASTFEGCSSLEEITIPNTVTGIQSEAFGHCTNLKKVTIPESVTSIDSFAFGSWGGNIVLTSPNLVVYGKKNSYADRFCNNNDIPFKAIIDATGVTLNKSSVALNAKQTYQLNASVKPTDAIVNKLTWKSSNTSVATVSSTGKITAVNSGTATITVTTDNGKSAKCSVTVYGDPTGITLNKGELSLGKGETYKLTATVNPTYAKDKSVKWRTSAPKILTVDQKGNVKAVGTGTAWITARTVNGKEKSCKITVRNAPTKVSLSKGDFSMGVGETFTLSAVLPDNTASSKRTFRTSNGSVIKMTKTDWTGSFKAMKVGTAWVTVRLYNGVEKSCKITVKPAPTNVYVNKKTINLKVGQTAKLSAYLNNGAACATRTFRSSAPSIVKMTKTNWEGEFKAMKKGVAWVTVRTYNGKEASCKVTVS